MNIQLTKDEYDEIMKMRKPLMTASGGNQVSGGCAAEMVPVAASGGGASEMVPVAAYGGGAAEMIPDAASGGGALGAVMGVDKKIAPTAAKYSIMSRSVAIQKSNSMTFDNDEILNIITWIYSNIRYPLESIMKSMKGNMLFINFVDTTNPAITLLEHKTFTIDDTVYNVTPSKSRPVPIDITSAIEMSKTNSTTTPTPILYLGFGPTPVDESMIEGVFTKIGITAYKIIIKNKNGNYFAFVTTNSIRTAMSLNQKKDWLCDTFSVHVSNFQIGYGKEPIPSVQPTIVKNPPTAPLSDTTNLTTIYIGCSVIAVTTDQIRTVLSKFGIPISNIHIRKITHYSDKKLYEAYVLTDSYENVQKAIQNSDTIADDLSVDKKYFRIGPKQTLKST